jgi:retron-type reverse transcriptase
MIAETLKENPEAGYNPPKVRRTKIVNAKGKKRVAHLAGIREQWYFHIIVEVMKPIIMKRLSNNSVGCIPGRGLYGGKKKLESLVRKGFKYFFKCDVRHFYDSVRIDIVINELRKDIADERFLYLIEKIYRYQKKGDPDRALHLALACQLYANKCRQRSGTDSRSTHDTIRGRYSSRIFEQKSTKRGFGQTYESAR